MTTCPHLDTIAVTDLPESVPGCEETPRRRARARSFLPGSRRRADGAPRGIVELRAADQRHGAETEEATWLTSLRPKNQTFTTRSTSPRPTPT